MTKCIGVRFKSGSFKPEGSSQELQYDNVFLQLISNNRVEGLIGQSAYEFKIKRSLFPEMDDQDWLNLIDAEIELVYGIVSGKPMLQEIKMK